MYCTSCGKEIENNSEFCPVCGKQIKESEEIEKSTKKVKVVWHRKKSFYGAAVSMKVHIDGNLVASLRSNESATVELFPGEHSAIFDMWSGVEKTTITVPEDCSTMYVELGIKIGLITNKIKILSIKNEK